MNNLAPVAAVACLLRVYAGWVTGELTDHQAAFAAVLLAAPSIGLGLGEAAAMGLAFMTARQAGYLDVERVVFKPSLTGQMFAEASAFMLLLYLRPSWLPALMYGGAAVLAADSARLLGWWSP